MSKRIYDKSDLVTHYRKFLELGIMDDEQAERFVHSSKVDSQFVIQKSSGCTGEPLLIPRTRTDLTDVAVRVLQAYADRYGTYPKRVALIGGVSHMQAAKTLNIAGVEFKHFELDQFHLLDEYAPEMLSCYPSMMREIMANNTIHLKQLRTIKLGGEVVLPADLMKIQRRFGPILVIEQYGSTEMPALALRIFEDAKWQDDYQLQCERFEFLDLGQEGWHPIIVKDNFPDLAMSLDGFYDTQDEAYMKAGQMVQVRRKGDNFERFKSVINQLLAHGVDNLQIHLPLRLIKYQGDFDLPNLITIDSVDYKVKRAELKRLHESKKMRLVL